MLGEVVEGGKGCRQMKLASVVRELGQRNGMGRSAVVEGIQSQRVFRSILRRERARVGRNSHGFCMVVFSYEGMISSEGAASDVRLLRLLSEQVRFTDVIGVLDDGDVGVLLPETASDGAHIFGQKIQYATARWPHPPRFSVLKYPDHDHKRSEDDPQLWLDGIAQCVNALCDGDQPAELNAPDADVAPSPAKEGMERYLHEPLPRWKRAFDIVAATFGLIAFAPIMLAMALLIKLTSPGPVLFKQERIGYLGKRFQCLKFRTMHLGSEVSSHKAHLHDLINSGRAMVKLDARRDPRILPFGLTIRKAGLDELAQLINILKGEMSFIGPRPCIPYEYDEYDHWHRMRTESHPGLTGLWQVSGKNTTTFTEMMRYDISYAQRLSPWLDLSIVVRTVPAIVKQFAV